MSWSRAVVLSFLPVLLGCGQELEFPRARSATAGGPFLGRARRQEDRSI